ncbi:hypothetical protein GCM10008983_16520 [Lentibacillus halophilus]|uniref:Uncharacterized protein n=1 Tax=Lentibacillus halophilus TaxID=295065 RepID=A0ABP3J607_9BACI
MTEDQFLIYNSQQKPIRVKPERMVFYRQAEIIEAVNESQEMYYLFFYNYHFLTAAKAKKLKRGSFIASAFKHGMVFHAPHPFINLLFSFNHSPIIRHFDTLMSTLKKRYTLPENAFILTFFESFVSKKRLFQEIKAMFYVYRRSGQTFQGYRIIRILMEFAPEHRFVREMSDDKSFTPYPDRYNSYDNEIIQADSIFAERTYYAHRHDTSYYQPLITYLESYSRWMDLLALYSEQLAINPSTALYQSFISLAEHHLDTCQIIQILEGLYYYILDFPPLTSDLLKRYADSQRVEKTLILLNRLDMVPQDAPIDAIRKMLSHLDLTSHSLRVELLHTLIQTVARFCAEEEARNIFHHILSVLLVTHEPEFIKSLLKPFMDNRSVHPFYVKMDRMETFSDDVEQMQPLGELYEEFDQLPKAMECFSWEMELNPYNPTPVKNVSNIYKKWGYEKEAKAYRELLKTMQKQS